MSAEITRHPVPRLFLERVSRPLLVRLLSPYADELAAHPDFSLAALEASAQTDRAQVDVIWTLLSAPPSELTRLHDELHAVARVATPGGHEVLISHDAAHVLDRELGAEDCAAIAFLEHRAIFDKARPQSGSSQTRTFATFQASDGTVPCFDAAHAATFVARMRQELNARGRSDHFKAHPWRSGVERHFELVYGRLAQSRDLLNKADEGHEVTRQVTDRSTERAHAIFHDDTLRLDVAGPDWVKELVRRNFGGAWFGAEDHFKGDEVVSLDPLLNLVAALSVIGVPGLLSVILQELWVDVEDGSGWVAVGSPGGLMQGSVGQLALRLLQEGGKFTQATFLLTTRWKTRPTRLVVSTPRKLDFDRRDPRIARIVRDWLLLRGYMRIPSHAAETSRATDEAVAPGERTGDV